jgi:uncharacterized membrane protein
MTDQTVTPPSPIPEVRRIALSDIRDILRLGWQDFRRAPAFGILFSGVYVLGGMLLYLSLSAIGHTWLLIPLVGGFPILAPFAAVGLYEVSRRLEAGEPLDWNAVLGVVWHERNRQIPSMAVVLLIFFIFWVFVARTIFALAFGGQLFRADWAEMLLTPHGITMLLVGSAIGGLMALAVFSLMVVSLPLLLEKEVDFVTAMITSYSAVRESPVPMLYWAATIAVLLFLAMLPLFLGLFLVLPLLGHASWHLYRRVLPEKGD